MSPMTDFIPNCELVSWVKPGGSTMTRLGVSVQNSGWITPRTAAEIDVARFKKSYGENWEPLTSPFLHNSWLAYKAILRAGGERAGFRPREHESRVCLAITESHLLGHFEQGVAVEQDNVTVRKLRGNYTLLFVWPLTAIDKIIVERKKGLLKPSDVGITITGAGSVLTA